MGAADESAFNQAAVNLRHNIFATIFLVYPMVTATLFRVPQCEQLGQNAFHEDDFSTIPPANPHTVQC
jgi:hypothetical protein